MTLGFQPAAEVPSPPGRGRKAAPVAGQRAREQTYCAEPSWKAELTYRMWGNGTGGSLEKDWIAA